MLHFCRHKKITCHVIIALFTAPKLSFNRFTLVLELPRENLE